MIVAVPMKNRVSPQLCMYVGSAQNFSTIGRVRTQFFKASILCGCVLPPLEMLVSGELGSAEP